MHSRCYKALALPYFLGHHLTACRAYTWAAGAPALCLGGQAGVDAVAFCDLWCTQGCSWQPPPPGHCWALAMGRYRWVGVRELHPPCGRRADRRKHPRRLSS
jgi:hypothetical protein